MTEGAAGDDVAIEPDLPIVDPHHHLWDGIPALGPRGGRRYHTPELLADLGAGHRIVQTVAIECGTHYFEDGPESLRPIGETLTGKDSQLDAAVRELLKQLGAQRSTSPR